MHFGGVDVINRFSKLILSAEGSKFPMKSLQNFDFTPIRGSVKELATLRIGKDGEGRSDKNVDFAFEMTGDAKALIL